jgi:hypothetical protein
LTSASTILSSSSIRIKKSIVEIELVGRSVVSRVYQQIVLIISKD